ncbi:MAG: DMT family transporter [Gammaproteobacteria bacterium]
MTHSWSRGALFALGGFGVFALHDALIKSLSGYAVIQIVFFAVLFSYVPLTFSLAADRQTRNLIPAQPGWVALRSLCMVGSIGFAFFAFQSLPLTQVYALLFATPFVITVLSIPMLGESVRAFRWFAIAIGSAGVLVALRPGAVPIELGHWSALLAVCCSALSAVTTRRLGHVERSATLMLYPLLANTLIMGCALVYVYEPMPFADLAKMAAIGALAMAGQYLIICAYRSARAAIVAPFQYSQMLWAVLYGHVWFHEQVKYHVYLGAAIIIFAGLLIVWRESKEGVSGHRPFLRTRNVRSVSAAPMRPADIDEQTVDDLDALLAAEREGLIESGKLDATLVE